MIAHLGTQSAVYRLHTRSILARSPFGAPNIERLATRTIGIDAFPYSYRVLLRFSLPRRNWNEK